MKPYVAPSPVNDAGDTLGTIISSKEKRDAIHLAVEPVFCKQRLLPGSHISHIGDNEVVLAEVEKGHGIVDPFLTRPVEPGEWFWFVMYPRQIRSLRHVWTHPAFEEAPAEKPPVDEELQAGLQKREEARQAILQICQDLGVRWDELEAATISFLEYGDYWCQGDRFDGEYLPPSYWDHYKVLHPTTDVSDAHDFLSCSC